MSETFSLWSISRYTFYIRRIEDIGFDAKPGTAVAKLQLLVDPFTVNGNDVKIIEINFRAAGAVLDEARINATPDPVSGSTFMMRKELPADDLNTWIGALAHTRKHLTITVWSPTWIDVQLTIVG